MNPFTLQATDPHSHARAGWLTTRSGARLPTPLFQPVATAGSVKTLDWRDLRTLGYRHVLMNTYHLVVRPGLAQLKAAGGLAGFTGWRGSILTDSGGYQAFSLAHKRSLRQGGVSFTDHIEGRRWEFTPESVLRAQLVFGVDFAMALDVCTGLPAPKSRVARELALTHKWAEQQAGMWPELVGTAPSPGNSSTVLSLTGATASHEHGGRSESERTARQTAPRGREAEHAAAALFGIAQGGLEEDLREESIAYISSLAFDGVAVGGLAVGEAREDFLRLTAFCGPKLPADRVRYLMGVGTPADLLFAIAHGFDLFDCVQPTRMARHGTGYTRRGSLPLTQARFAADPRPLDPRCTCYTCATHSRAYLRHLFTLKEHSYARLLTLHNLHFYRRLLAACRRRILAGTYGGWWEKQYARVEGVVPAGE